jgi:hypothetical protein
MKTEKNALRQRFGSRFCFPDYCHKDRHPEYKDESGEMKDEMGRSF